MKSIEIVKRARRDTPPEPDTHSFNNGFGLSSSRFFLALLPLFSLWTGRVFSPLDRPPRYYTERGGSKISELDENGNNCTNERGYEVVYENFVLEDS